MFTLAEQLVELGHTCTLVALSETLAEEWTGRGLGDAVVLDAPVQYDRRGDLAALLRGRKLVPACDALVLFSFALLPAIPVLRAMPRFRRTVFALDLHDNLPGAKGQAMLRGLARSMDAVIAVSHFTAAQVSSPKPVVLLRPVTPPDAAAYEVTDTESPLAIGIVGRLDPAKQHLLAIDALALTDAKVRLV